MFAKCRMANLTFRPVVKTVVNSPFVNVSVFVLVPQMSLCEYPPPMHHRGHIGGLETIYLVEHIVNPTSTTPASVVVFSLRLARLAITLLGAFLKRSPVNVFSYCQHTPILTVCRTSGIFQLSALRSSAPTSACNAGSTVYATSRNFCQVSISCCGKKASSVHPLSALRVFST